MNLSWYVKRLSRMSIGEAGGRATDLGRKWLWRSRRGTTTFPNSISLSPNLLTSALCGDVERRIDGRARCALLHAADELLAGNWQLFGRTVKITRHIDWFRDPQTGLHGDDRSYCFRARYRNESRTGNVKFLWELSRHQHLTVLAAAYRLSHSEQYAERIAEQLNSWWAANPFLTGIHWSSGIELGLRLISWVWIRRLLAAWPGCGDLFDRNPAFLAQLFYHQKFLAAFQSRGSSANNHLIGEAAGLFVASAAFSIFPRSRRWRHKAARILEREILIQTDGQGLNRELATDYHAFVLELLLVAAIEGDAAGTPLSPQFWQRLQSMVDALAAMLDTSGRPPRQGDSDNGTALLLDAPQFHRWGSLLSTGAWFFNSLPWWGRPETGDVRTALLAALGEPHRGLAGRPATRPAQFNEAGLVVLRDTTPGEPELWCRCDYGPHGFLSIAAHAHADALSIELRHGGVDILADPGTYCYHGEWRWRRYFRSTLGHNTLELGGRDQAIGGGPFLWLTHPAARLECISGASGGPKAVWAASHDGYLTALGATHHRSVTLLRGPRRIVIEDWIASARAQDARLAFHLGPAVTCKLVGHLASLSWVIAEETFSALLALPEQMTWRAFYGDEPLGWYSEGFGRKSPSVTLIGSMRLAPELRLVTTLAVAPAPDPSAEQFGNVLSPARIHTVAYQGSW